jgi:hypothetical protein
METDLRETNPGVEARSSRRLAGTSLALRHRLAISALVVGVSLFVRVAELTPERRRA